MQSILIAGLLGASAAGAYGAAKYLADRYQLASWQALGFTIFVLFWLMAGLAFSVVENRQRQNLMQKDADKRMAIQAAEKAKLLRFEEERACLEREKAGVPFSDRCRELLPRP